MKKILFTVLTAFTLGSNVMEAQFLTKTCYRGAFAPAPAPMWTDTWTEWDPQNAVYPAPTVTISADITANTTWSTGTTYLLAAQCHVKNNSVLTIQPGVIIRGQKAFTGACLLVCTGSSLIANGTATAPIVFTSDQAPGLRTKGDWGGIILCGLANNNCAADVGTVSPHPAGVNYVEGLAVNADNLYGGTNDNDNSGILRYVRIEFPGYVYQPNKEINGLTMGSVGKGTTIDYVQSSYSNDDSFEWFGGAVNCKHLVAYRGLDDDFDTDNGFSGQVQFCLGVRDPNISDNPAVSTSEGFESDNDPNGTTSTPLTSAIFSNITDIGPLRGVPTATLPPGNGFARGARIRRNSNLKIINSIIMDHKTRGLYIDGTLCEGNANTGALKFKNNIVAGYGQRAMETNTNILVNPNLFIASQPNDTLLSTAGILTTPYSYTAPDYRPAPGSIAMSGASFTDVAIAPATGTVASTNAATMPSTFCIANGTTIVTTATFVASSTMTPNYCSASWSVSPGVTISNTAATNPSFTISTVGTYSVWLTVIDANGTSTVLNTVTTTSCVGASVKENSNLIGNVSLFPNPSADATVLKVDALNALVLNVSILDVTGKLVATPAQNKNLVAGETLININTNELSNGLYFVTLSSDKGKETVKLIVNH